MVSLNRSRPHGTEASLLAHAEISNFLGLALFSGAEIWASLSERSANLQPTPADKAVLTILGVASAPVSPTVVVVAFLLPFASLYYGFSQQQRRESEEERAEQAAAADFALPP